MDDDVSLMLRQSAEDFLRACRSSAARRGVRELPAAVDRARWSDMADLGWLGLGLPEALGGTGLGLDAATELVKLFGQHAFPEPFVACCVMPSVILAAAPDGPVRREIAEAMSEGRRIVTVAWQESDAELVPADRGACVHDRTLSGRKIFVPSLEAGGVILASAQTRSGPVVVAVDADRVGDRVQRHLSGMGTFSTIDFDRTPVIGDAPLIEGDAALAAVRASIEAANIALAALLTGIAKGALDATLTHIGDRVQFGRPIGSFQVIQHRCVDLHLGVQLADASWRNALRAQRRAACSRESSLATSAAKARASDVALQVTRAAIQMHGAMGFTDEAEPGFFLRAAMHGAAWLGTANLHRRRFHGARSTEAAHA
ncbi:MAG: acyl-CoA/acyl-ACP dehydrogenase [Burkholderiales bacterium]|nr:acyl-CoA/acyl-ACP dehydrogenase [Burkholderiales bacterium]